MNVADIDVVIARLDALDARLESFEQRVISRELVEERLRGQGERIGRNEMDVQALQDERTWLTRLVVGAVVAAVLALVVGVAAPVV